MTEPRGIINISDDELMSDLMKTTDFSSDNESIVIKSDVVIKKSEVEFPVQFHQLQCNTDIRRPPTNWLLKHSSVAIPNSFKKHTDFSSFLMAHQFPDCIGEVDVVSDAANIKKLLKIPYNPKAHVSMIIHRIGKTLLIDEFDVYKYLLRQSDKEWKWLKDFFFEHILQSITHKEKQVLVRPNKSRDVQQSRNLFSKFLHHSIGEGEIQIPSTAPIPECPVSVQTSCIESKDKMPEPSLEEQLPESSIEPFTRNIIWNFEDLQMLIGTDLPIFGGRTHPCVSLKLRDMKKPISILTGIDYWLDNLMCNVPEVVMCFHLDGIVQKYELVKTEDLPQMQGSSFSPKLVRDIAHNILSFLKSKATKEGHTYWLFKAKDDDIVKLYDLTSLCKSKEEEEEESNEDLADVTSEDYNPFTTPVAMLFYQVAKNIRASQDSSTKQSTIKALLHNSLMLLDKNKYPQIFCSASYMLADLYIPQHIDPKSPHLFDSSDQETDDSLFINQKEDKEDDKETVTSKATREKTKKLQGHKKSKKFSSFSSTINASSLCLPYVAKASSPNCIKSVPLQSNINERCIIALEHIVSALNCLQVHLQKHNLPASNKAEFTNISASKPHSEPQMANPYQAIPMPYSKLNCQNDKNENAASKFDKQQIKDCIHHKLPSGSSSCQSCMYSTLGKTDKLTVAVLSRQYNVSSWGDKLHVLLLRKTSLVYLILSYHMLNNMRYGSSLNYVELSLDAWRGMASFLGLKGDAIPIPCQALLLKGDAYFMLGKDWHKREEALNEFNTLSDVHGTVKGILEKIVYSDDNSMWSVSFPSCALESLIFSGTALQESINACDTDTNVALQLKRKLASVYNELAVIYMNDAVRICDQEKSKSASANKLFEKSATFFGEGLALFREADDVANVALLHSNLARLLRLCAYYTTFSQQIRHLSNAERSYYEQCISEYQKAIEVLSCRETNRSIRDLVIWEYCTTLFTMGSIIQDFPSQNHTGTLTEENRDRETSEVLNKALSLCDVKTSGPRLPLYQYRAALIYMRLAGIHHKAFRQNSRDQRNGRRLAELNYSRAAALFVLLENAADIIKVFVDYVVLLHDVSNCSNNNEEKMNLHLATLQLLTKCLPTLKGICETKEHEREEKRNKSGGEKKKDKEKKRSEEKQCKVQENISRDKQLNIGKGTKCSLLSETHNSGNLSDRLIEDEEEAQANLFALLQAYEKKLQFTLFSIIKLINSSNVKKRVLTLKTWKQLYSSSLNTKQLPLEVHLTKATHMLLQELNTIQD